MNHDIEPDFHELDKNRLDEEWVNQPRLYREYADKLAEAERDLSRAEAALKVTRADAELAIRENPAKFGLEKVVEAAVKARVETHKAVVKAHDEVIRVQYRVSLLKAACRTLEHRKAALQELVTLWQNDYFATPRVKGEAGRAMTEQAKRAARRAGQRRTEDA